MKTCALSLLLALAGCSVIHGDDFSQDEGCDLELRLRGFNPHVADTTTFVLNRANRDGTSRRVEAVAIFDPLGTRDLDLQMPFSVRPRRSVDQGLAAVDFYADFDDVEGFSFPGDHSWVLEDVCTTGPEEFPHNTDFIPIRIPEAAGTTVAARFCGSATAFGSSAVEVRVTRVVPDENDDRRVVNQAIGFYRLDDITRRPEGLGIPLIANTDFDITVEVVADRNRNGTFDEGDIVWAYSHDGDAPVPCSELPLNDAGCPNATVALRSPLAVCVTPSRDLVVVVSPLTNGNRTSTLLAESWFRAVTP